MKPYYASIKDDLQEEKKSYAEELKKTDWEYLKEASELFLIHAYSHLFKTLKHGYEVFGDTNYKIKYSQFYLNLAVGLELLLKSILLKKGVTINLTPERTIQFRWIIEEYLNKIFPKLGKTTFEEIKDTLKLVNLRRNNIAHCSKRSRDSYLHEHRFSYITLYIYQEFFYGENPELTELLLKSIDRSKVTTGADFKRLRIKPRSLRG
ncbi:hypothetical protein ES703_88087 [subsurface metagenome]